jgi:outer membrane protein OmpA-like peptidoglycan-associated protein
MSKHSSIVHGAVGFGLLGCLASLAAADPELPRWSVKLEPSVGSPVAGPQLDAFGVGGGGFAKGSYGLRDWLDLQLGVGGFGFSAKSGSMSERPAGLIAMGGGVRLQLPHSQNRISPFLDGGALYVRTGPLNRPAFSVSIGALVRMGRADTFRLGFQVQYLQVLQSDRSGFDTTDGDLLLFGLVTQFSARGGGRGRNHDTAADSKDRCPGGAGLVENGDCPEPDSDRDGVPDVQDKCPGVPGLVQFAGCADRDGDGVPDPTDLCPGKAGPVDNGGCPRYREIVVTRTRIELNQKIFFAYDRAEILPKSFSLLAEVATAFKDYPGLKVRIEGHTDSRGSVDRNMKLSQDRAEAVLNYLVAQGVSAQRFSGAKGYGPEQPLDTNNTPDGRERNRRVEFVVEGLGDESVRPTQVK